MKRKLQIAFGLILVVLLAACGSGAPKVDWTLSINGAVAAPLELSFKDLTSKEQVELNEIMMEKSTGEDEITSWSGVSLDDLLEEAGAVDGFVSITAVASDGYSIEITSEELADGIVALKDSGKWIAETAGEKGPIRLVTPLTPANRWVFQLTEIQVNEQ